MNEEKLYRLILGPVVSEKTTSVAEKSNQVVFNVLKSATKGEIAEAIERLFGVKVEAVRTLVLKGKVKRSRSGVGRRSDWKKAYVSLERGHEIDFLRAE